MGYLVEEHEALSKDCGMQAEFDVTIFGATGFTGRLAAIYLCRHYPQLKIAIAGRNHDKLTQVAQACSRPPEIILADASQPQQIEKMILRSQVLANFAGPFSLYGEAVVAACVQHGRHYCDITGETPWVKQMMGKYHAQALQSGACLIPFAGFDSVPADILSDIALHEAERNGILLDEIVHHYQIRGGLNGGTLASALTIAEQGQAHEITDGNLLINDPQWPENNPPVNGPLYEPVIDRWTAPFFMNLINRTVVRRSTYLRKLRGDAVQAFHYEERMVVGPGIAGRLQAELALLTLWMFSSVTRQPWGRAVFRKLGPQPGEGPTELQRAGSYYRGRLIGRSQGVPKVMVTADCQGDPGNEVTVTFAAEIAKLLSEQAQGPHCKGFSTPSVAFAAPLIERLKAAGVGFKVELL